MVSAYLFFFTFVGASISAKLLQILLDHDLDSIAIDRIYDTSGMVHVRLLRLLKGGFLTHLSAEYTVSRRGQHVVSVFSALGRFFRHDRE